MGIVLAVASAFLSGCDRPARPERYSAFFSNADLAALAVELNRNVREGRLRALDSGRNVYPLAFTGSPSVYTVTVTVDPRTVIVPLGVAQVSLNALRFREAFVRWNAREHALQVELEIQDKEDGIIGTLRVLQERRELKFVVESARLTLTLEPRVGANGTLDFAPVRGEFTANTDDAIPEVRAVVREQINELSRSMTAEIQTSFNRYRSDVTRWFSTQLADDAALTAITVANDGATIFARSRTDITQDGIVDIADLVQVARDFGATGVPGFASTDVNADGQVDIADLVRVALRFGAIGAPSIRPRRTR
jgi:hypothetical protein